MKPKIGVILAGCGVYDGSEVTESVLTLLALEKAGAEPVCMAPDKEQLHVINHLTGEETGEKRNVLVESARIVRGNIEDVAAASADDLDALVLPGGFGAAKNLSRFAVDGPDGEVDPGVRKLIEEVHGARKPIGFICITPAIAAQVLGGEGVEVTIGTDDETASAIESCGARHVKCAVDEIHEDPERRVVSTPAYMLGQGPAEVAPGIDKLVQTVMAWIR
ncbi:MAG: isoprenoid biosynthesis glyoxalase ElbB [Verrucomicrobia bacterium]|jgi:enhancing lycopene biosynthesis protein 2|nr:isoprenoid biosynthesis glyoxalase ElbB [Verrucomicrobiota bacterium]